MTLAYDEAGAGPAVAGSRWQIAVRLAGEIADAELVELGWAGHLPSLERPDLVNPLLVAFLRGKASGLRGKAGGQPGSR